MTTNQPAPWLQIAHTITAEIPTNKTTADTVARFITEVPGHAELALGEPNPATGTRTIYATWPHEPAGTAETHGFNIATDLQTRPADYALQPVPAPTTPDLCSVSWNDRPCTKPRNHDGVHLYQSGAARGDLYPRKANP